ncbi:MAG: helix-turn-helix transcriptional regulator [Bradyrhizobium sp.]|nr:helix-turn-helix transcriptional regulator [Bradyrhizobium sp.]
MTIRRFDATDISRKVSKWGPVCAEIVECELKGRADLHFCVDEHVVILELSKGVSGERRTENRVERFASRPGLISFRPAGCELRGWSTGSGTMRYARFALAPSLLDNTVKEENWKGVNLHAVTDLRDPVLLQSARTLVQECASPGSFGALFAEGLGLTMLARLLRHFSEPRSPMRSPSGGLAPFRLRRALEYIAANLGNDLRLADLARLSELSLSQFVRGFRASMGITPLQYVLAQRIERAKELLAHPDASLADIALRCGFADQSYFTNRFRSLIGTTPGQFRQSML